MTVDSTSFDEAVEILGSAQEIAVACHISPDGDAIGSAIGLARSARLAGLRAVASFGSPFTLSSIYEYLDRGVLVPPKEFPREPSVMVSVDAASLDRLGELAPNAHAARKLVVVDHHISNPGFGTVDLIDAEAGATAQLIAGLLTELGWPIDRGVADALLTGIVTDTGRFQYSNTTPALLRIAADLVEAGARPEVIGQNMYERVPFAYLKLEADVLGRCELADGLVWSVLYLEDLERHQVGLEDADQLIDAIRIAWEAQVAALIKETSDGRYKVSLRSRGKVDVGAIAANHGGGGHHNAAGFTHDGPIEAIVANVEAAL